MSAFRPPPPPAPSDSEPGPSPSLPPGTLGDGLWSDGDELRGPVAAFSTQSPDVADQRHPTIGHIGRYALKHQLGEGGLGTVYAAHDPLLSRLIAVKTLHVEIDESEREAFNALFLNEARAAAALNHPHIVTVFDAGVSDKRAYIAMELLRGRDLRQLREEGWRATPTQAALIVRRIADALGYAHSKGVVHRDVKPANIFMIGRTQPKVLDFGIARIAHHHDVQGTPGEIVAGSPYYMAPEQAVPGNTVDRRADVFSLGVVLYELLTDTKPFRGENLEQITKAVMTHEPPLASTVDPSVPVALAEITARAMAKNPDHRFRSARAFGRELRDWLDATAATDDGEVALPPPQPPRSRRPVAAIAAAATVLVAGLLWFALAGRDGDRGGDTAVAAPTVATVPATVAVKPAAVPAAEPVASEPAAALPVEAAASDSLLAVANPSSEPASAAALAPDTSPAASATRPTAAAAVPPKRTAAITKKETAAERRAREAAAAIPAVVATGLLRVAVSPWGDVEIDGRKVGTSPPLTELALPAGRHQIVLRNTDLPAYSASIEVTADQPITVKHKF